MRTKIRKAEQAEPAVNGTSSTLWIKASNIRVDPDTQRMLRPSWVKHIADNFDPDQLGIIHVARRRNSFYVIDGQHRVFACRLRNDSDRLLECKVYNDVTKPDEAKMFVGLNNQKAVRAYDKFRVRLNYDADAQAINKMIESVGLRLADQSEDGNITAVRALEDVYNGRPFRSKEPTPWALAKALRTLTGAWGMNRDAVSGTLILAAGALHLRYGNDVNAEQLARKLALFNGGPIGIVTRAKLRREVTHGTLWRSAAEVMVDVYNKGLRKNPLPPFTR